MNKNYRQKKEKLPKTYMPTQTKQSVKRLVLFRRAGKRHS